jgi:predicted enzyme related to lactoylglutathione lyase
MATVTQHAPGTFCWPELVTIDQAGAKKFYTSLFGWTFEDSPLDQGGTYTMLKLKGMDVGALHQMDKERQSQGIPPHWGAYVSVESADQATTKAKSLGANVLMEPFDVMDVGRMAILQDPTGAVFQVWEARKHIGASVLDEPGSLCWTELMTNDPAKAEAFYKGLLPWQSETMPMGPAGNYTVFKRAQTPAAGMMKIQPEMGPIPAHWLSYFAVEDCNVTAAHAKDLGGKVGVPPTNVPNVGRFAVIQDPQGAYFGILGPEKK